MSKEVKAALIGGICVIIGAIIGTIHITINVNTENEKLKRDYEKVVSENSSLKENIDSLMTEIENLKLTIQEISSELNNQKVNDLSAVDSRERISIFDLEPSKGNVTWLNLSSEYEAKASLDIYGNEYGDGDYLGPGFVFNENNYIDTNGNKYYTGYACIHSKRFIEKESHTYILNKEYSTCEGQIVWSKNYADLSGSVWIEFYSNKDLVYRTGLLTADNCVEEFVFPIDKYDNLTIVGMASKEGIYVLYPYFNFVK